MMVPCILVKQKLGYDEGDVLAINQDPQILSELACKDAGVEKLNWMNVHTGCVGYDDGFGQHRYLITVVPSEQVLVV